MKVEIVLGGALLIGGLGLIVFMALKPPISKLGSDFDTFTSYKVADTGPVTYNTDPSSCKRKCIADPKCRGFSFDLEDNSCFVTTKDPYTYAEETPKGQWQVYIRRKVGTPASSWGPWDKICPKCGEKKDVIITRECYGPHCLGPNKHECDVMACFDMFQGFDMK